MLEFCLDIYIRTYVCRDMFHLWIDVTKRRILDVNEICIDIRMHEICMFEIFMFEICILKISMLEICIEVSERRTIDEIFIDICSRCVSRYPINRL
jgi:hypothetical protein